MKLTDSIKLAVKGYKPADIKRLDESGLDTETILQLSGAGYSVTDVDELINIASDGRKAEGSNNNDTSNDEPDANDVSNKEEKPDDVDYKKMFEESQKMLTESQELVKKLQDMNASKNLGSASVKSPRELVDEALKNLY